MGDRENTGQQQQQRGEHTQPPLPPAAAPLAANPDQPHPNQIQHPPQTEPHNAERWFQSPDWHMVWITALLFIVGVYTAWVFHKQFTEMQTQTGILNGQAKTGCR